MWFHMNIHVYIFAMKTVKTNEPRLTPPLKPPNCIWIKLQVDILQAIRFSYESALSEFSLYCDAAKSSSMES